MSGSVVGVVVSQLNALAVMKIDNSVPQNINFAIQVPMVVNFLSIKGITPKLDTTQNGAATLSVEIFCETGSPSVAEKPSAPSSPPPPTPSGGRDVEQRATNFIIALQANWSRQNSEALSGLDELYDDEVLYFGKKHTKAEVIKEASAFAAKFPERQYKPRVPVAASCNDRLCTVRGTLDFKSVNPAGRKVSKGVATFEYHLVVAGSSFKIDFEDGEVLKREISPLASVSSHR
jgi:hypothetical protein